MTMVALDIAFNSIKGENDGNPAEVMRKINELTRLVENTLKG